MKMTLMALAIASITGFQVCAFANADCSKEESYSQVSKADLQKIVEKKSAFIIDVNGTESFKKSHVPGAVHFAAMKKSFASSLPADKSAEIIAYCGGPMCSAWLEAAEKACNLGYTNIKHFKEGISGWNNKSL